MKTFQIFKEDLKKSLSPLKDFGKEFAGKSEKFAKSDDAKKLKTDDLNMFIRDMFNVCEINDCKIWGVYPVDNPYFMSNKVTFDLKYIAAGFMGIINEHDKDLLVELEDKEDFERSIKYFIKYKNTHYIIANYIIHWLFRLPIMLKSQT